MFLLYSVASVILLIGLASSGQCCLGPCSFNHNFDDELALPQNCTASQWPRCSAVLTFDYTKRQVHMQFGLHVRQPARADVEYTTELISNTVVELDGDSSATNTVEYYCSNNDTCEYDYVVNHILPVYVHKTCHRLRAHLIAKLHADPSSSSRLCVLNDANETTTCGQPCELFFMSPNQTRRTCDSPKPLQFQASLGRTTPINKPEYAYRLYSYTCTTDVCNGYTLQQEIEKLINRDDGECLAFLDNDNRTSTARPSNHAEAFSSNFWLAIALVMSVVWL